MAVSPSGWAILCIAVAATQSGMLSFSPSTETDRSTVDTSLSTRGTRYHLHTCVIVEEVILQLHLCSFFLLTKIHSHSDVHWKTETDWFWKENTFLFLQLKALVEAHQYTNIDKVLGCYIYLNYILHSCWKPLSFQRRRLGALQVCSSVFVKAACMANSWILYTCGNGTENTWIQR